MRLTDNAPSAGGLRLESDARFYRRRVTEELAAAGRAVTDEARERRMVLVGIFLDKLKVLEAEEAAEQSFEDA